MKKFFLMRFNKTVPLTEIASLIGAKIIGDANKVATGINEIHKVEEGDLVFVDHPKYYQKCINSAASFIIINQETDFPSHKALLLVDDPFEAYQKNHQLLSSLYSPLKKYKRYSQHRRGNYYYAWGHYWKWRGDRKGYYHLS